MSTLFVEPSESEIEEQLKDVLTNPTDGLVKVSKLNNFNAPGPTATTIKIFARLGKLLYKALGKVLTQCSSTTATGVWLELWCLSVNVKKKKATNAKLHATFFRLNTQPNKTIQRGKIIKINLDISGIEYRYFVDSDVVFPGGQAEMQVPVTAENTGTEYNSGATTDMSLVSSIPGVDGVRFDAGPIVTEAQDDELDPALRNRYSLKWEELNGMTAGAYESWGYAVDGVYHILVKDWHPAGPGTVDLVVTGTAGVPTQALVGNVRTNVLANNPGTDTVAVYGVVGGPQNLELDIITVKDFIPDVSFTNLCQTILAALFQLNLSYPDIKPFKGGEDMVLEKVAFALLNETNKFYGKKVIHDIDFITPALDVAIDDNSLATQGNEPILNITQGTEE